MLVPKPPEVTCGVWDYSTGLSGALQRKGHEVIGRLVGGKAPFRLTHRWRKINPLFAPFVAKSKNADYFIINYEPWAYGKFVHLITALCRLMDVRTILVMHSVFLAGPDEKPKGLKAWAKKILTRMLVKNCDTCLVSNRADEETLLQDIFRSVMSRDVLVKIHRIPIGSNVPHILREKERPWNETDTLRICTLGINRPRKGLENTMAALKILADRRVRFHWMVLGDWPRREYRDGFETLIKEWGLNHYTTVVGRLKSTALAEKLAECHIGVFLEERGCTLKSTSLLGAYSSGIKCVCYARREGALEPLAPDPAISIIGDRAPLAVADAIMHMARSDAWPSHKKFEMTFGWDAIEKRWEEVLGRETLIHGAVLGRGITSATDVRPD